MYLNFEGLEPGENIKKKFKNLVSPDPIGLLNQKKLLSTIIYQFEHLLQ
jgi:hypothetical protein